MALSHLPILLDTVSENTDVLAQQNRDNIDRIYAYLQGLISGIEEQDGINAELIELASEAQPSNSAQYIVGAPDASLNNERVVTNSPTITWDLSIPDQLKAHAVVVATVPLTAVRVTQDQVINALSDVTAMSFPVTAGHYYNIRFAIIARSNTLPSDVAFRITTPSTTAYAALGVS